MLGCSVSRPMWLAIIWSTEIADRMMAPFWIGAPEEADFPLGAWEYHSSMNLIQNSEKKPLRIFTHVSANDNGVNRPEKTYHNWVMANERTAAALKSKDYDFRYVFSRATKHCDRRVFEETLADTLVWMWRGYHAE